MKKALLCIAVLLILLVPVVFADEAEFTIENEYLRAHFRPDVEAATAAWVVAILGAVALLLLALKKWHHLPKKQRTFWFLATTLVKIAILLVVVYMLWSTYSYMFSGVSKTGLETCDASGCSLSVHWHAYLDSMTMCGKTVERPWEEGDLSGAHTHKDNRIHVHTLLAVDPQTHAILDTTDLTLGDFFNAIKWKFNTTCFKDACDCNGAPAQTHVRVNGNDASGDVRNVTWKDGDRITIDFS